MKVGDLVRINIKGKPMGLLWGKPYRSRVRGGALACDVIMLKDWKIDGWAVSVIEVISEGH